MPFRHLSPGIEILAADGRFTAVEGRSSAHPVILLARDLCAFEHRKTVGRYNSSALAEARLHAQRAAPFLNSASLVRRQGAGVSIWWWDRDLVEHWLSERFGDTGLRVLPLSLVQPPGDGWRIVGLDRGYEAQFWEQGALVASAWSLEPYDRKAWPAFTRLQRGAVALQDPPAPVRLPIDGARLRAARMPDLGSRDILRGAVAAGVAGLLLTSVFSLGQGVRLDNETRALAATSPATLPGRPPGAGDAAGRLRLQAYRTLEARPEPLPALAVALGIADQYGADPTAYAADLERVSLTLPYGAMSSLDRIAQDLRDTGLFTEIRTATGEGGQAIELTLVLAPRGR